MPWDDPFLRLSDHIVLTPAEAAQLLEVLDIATATAGTEEERVAIREAVRMITRSCGQNLATFSTATTRRSLRAMTTS